MTDQINYLVFKGTSKKEEILFKSFLNLAKNDLSYQLIVLKDDQLKSQKADIVILDDSHQLVDEDLKTLPTIVVGDDHQNQNAHYISRPVQWSDFKNALTGLDVESSTPVEVEETSKVLPTKMNFEIAEMGADAANLEKAGKDGEKAEPAFSDEGDYEYELDKMSIGYHSFTNSDYIKVVDDVKQFQDGGLAENHDPVILVTDDESSSVNSVLVIETNSLDAWDFSHAEFDTTQIHEQVTQKTEESKNIEVVTEQRAGFEINPDEKFWLEDNEIISDKQTFLFIKPARKMVYSDREPGKWPALLQRGALSKVALADDWRPTKEIQVYPLSRLLWANTLVTKTNDLASGLSEEKEYLLEKWPHFDVLELDNVLLKLCTMLFIRPESVASLSAKSGYGRSTIRGLFNASHEMGILATPDSFVDTQLVRTSAEDGMLGKIKEVFK